MPLDLTQPYAVVVNDPYGRVFQQDDVFYRGDASVWTAPTEFVEDMAHMKVNSGGEVIGLVRFDGTVASVSGGLPGTMTFDEENGAAFINPPDPDTNEVGSSFNCFAKPGGYGAEGGNGAAILSAYDGRSEANFTQISAGPTSRTFLVGTTKATAYLEKDAALPFSMTNFDVAASDASARMTVGGVQYSIAKAIAVKVGASTYYWPLFGPAV
jgi:hypothetical protein